MEFFRPADEPALREFYKEESFAHEDVDEVLEARLIIKELIKHMKILMNSWKE